MIELQHGRVRLALHELASGSGLPLLLLHELGGSSDDWGEAVASWPGPVHGLDFCGHGASGWLTGGSYSPELFSADADTALARLGPAAVAGAGLGAYVALLLAGARPDQVPAALLLPGSGLDGAGDQPSFGSLAEQAEFAYAAGTHDPDVAKTDPRATSVERQVRPLEYTSAFGGAARRLLLAEDGGPRPSWWAGLRELGTSSSTPLSLQPALTQLANASCP